MQQSVGTFPSHAVAIVGLAGRFPNAHGLDDFWRNVSAGVESLETATDDYRQHLTKFATAAVSV